MKSSGRLELVSSSAELSALLGAKFEARVTSGHTVGMLHTWVTGARASAFFCADLVPGAAWVHLPVTMGYDRAPELLIDEKRAFLEDKLARGVRLFFTHDVQCALARVTRDEKGRFGTADELPELTGLAA